MKIVGISTIGTYPNHIDFGVASCYHFCDEFLVVNGGYDVKDPEVGCDFVLERERDVLKDIDVANKITQVKSGWDKVHGIDDKREEAGRGRNMTQAVQYAAEKMDADIVLKFDSDNIMDPSSLNRAFVSQLFKLNGPGVGYRFGQYELHKTFNHFGKLPDWAAEDNRDFPSSNDAPQMYAPNKDDWYVGGGAPVVSAHIVPHQTFISYHVRNVPPPDVSPYEYFYKRLWYHTYAPWKTGELKNPRLQTYRDVLVYVEEIATAATEGLEDLSDMNEVGSSDDPRAPRSIPEVITIGAKAWIEKVMEETNAGTSNPKDEEETTEN